MATAHEGSTRAGAGRVARSQSATSKSLAELEVVLNVQLFDRVGRRLILNEHGRALLPRAVSLLDAAADVEQAFGASYAAPLRVAASMTIGEHLLPPLVSRWRAAHPTSPVRLLVSNSAGVLTAVAGFDADIGFVEGTQTHPELHFRPWLSDAMVVVASPRDPIAQGRATREQLRSRPWALREPGSGTREAADRWLAEQLGEVRVAFEMGTPGAIKSVVAEGDALGLLPRHAVAAALARGDLAEVDTGLPIAYRRLLAVVHRERRLGQGASAFLDHCFLAAAAQHDAGRAGVGA